MSDVAPGGQFSAGSYEGHEFEIREVPADNSGTCNSSQDQTCKVQYVQVHGGEKDGTYVKRMDGHGKNHCCCCCWTIS